MLVAKVLIAIIGCWTMFGLIINGIGRAFDVHRWDGGWNFGLWCTLWPVSMPFTAALAAIIGVCWGIYELGVRTAKLFAWASHSLERGIRKMRGEQPQVPKAKVVAR